MKYVKFFLLPAVCALALVSCKKAEKDDADPIATTTQELLSKSGVAQMLASLPIEADHISEVWGAVSSSEANGYDEEYMMCDLLSSPGAGVGDSPQSRAATRAQYSKPIRDLIAAYLSEQAAAITREGSTKASEADLVQQWLADLSSSGLQIYWPYSSDWDGETTPLVTFDPGYGASDNYAWEIAWEDGAYKAMRQVYVDETVAASRPVCVINSNDDSGFTPLELFSRAGVSPKKGLFDFDDDPDPETPRRNLFIKDFTMLRNYDSWFAGASEFFIQTGSVTADYGESEVNPGSFNPEITQLMIVVKRRQVGLKIPYEAMLLSNFPDELSEIALLITESDGGTRTTWKASAKVMIKSKSYGVDMEFPLYSNDDMVWRGPLSIDYLRKLGSDEGRFGDVRISFEVE